MSTNTEMGRKICDFLKQNGKSTALIIAKDIGADKSTVNKHLYNLERANQVFKTDKLPPVWDLMEKKNEIKQTLKPQQKSQTTRDTSEDKHVEDLLRSGGLKAQKIASKLGQSTPTIKKQLYSMEKNEIKQTLKPQQKSQTTRDTSEEKHVEDLLRSGGLKKAHQIARELGQSRQTINKQLYSLEKEGKVKKCSKSSMWTLNEEWSDDSFSQESSSSCPSDHGLDSISGLQNFELIAKLGEGGFGCVYKVKHKYDEKIYAVKRVILTGTADSEVKTLARLDHPNIVRYITCWPDSDTSNQGRNQVSNTPGSSSDVVTFDRDGCEEREDEDEVDKDDEDDDDDDEDVTSGMESLSVTESASAAAESSGNNRTDGSNHTTYLFIQMEFCEGGTLTDWIKARNHMEKQRTTVEIHQIFYEIITGVEYIHANKLIHRDLKPDNILFGADDNVKIGDFGLVAAQTDQNGDLTERSNRGTRTYMSPEQKYKNNYDEKTDIFPLGLVWFEMIWKISTGSEREKLWTDLRDRRLPEGFSDCYQTENTYIMKMLSYSPEHRPDAKYIKEKLEKFFSLDQNLLSQKTV
ncbi:eukaryotic translation initiation factor 2-alpha kinase 3-like isoform X2 [Onychostoma macrolepis]|uniref:eukaryotic translation initiation factor 2-alpha kinase 3-like isoform X2 n=1 Tax=Onychostoma macrolepis TaxID=369639 RepID=UPI002729D375|nr:eukaryotic translation initiation factor 2-alpha kinase 3-like isoform X2 [Onychostoma macrolepis]